MSQILVVYEAQPGFPPTDQNPDARRYVIGEHVVDAIGGKPTEEEIEAFLAPSCASAASEKLDQHLTASIAEFSPKENAMPETEQATVLVPVPPAPPAAPAVAPAKTSAAVATAPAAHGLNIKQMMEEHMRVMGQIHDAQMLLLAQSLQRQREVVSNAVGAVAGKIDGQTDDFLSIMGQFTNDLGLE